MSVRPVARHLAALLCAVLVLAGVERTVAAPEGIGMHFTPVARWLDPAEGESTINPYLLLYTIHDGLLKPMPGVGSGPSLAVKFSFERYRGGAAKVLKDSVKESHTPALYEDLKLRRA